MDSAMRARVCLLTKCLIAAVGVAGSGCGLGDEPAPAATTLTVWNRAQTELLGLYVHAGETYEGKSLLAAALETEASVDIPFTQGQRVTVLRRPVPLADPLAFTTARDLAEVDALGYTLIVFDRSFRLMSPGEDDTPAD